MGSTSDIVIDSITSITMKEFEETLNFEVASDYLDIVIVEEEITESINEQWEERYPQMITEPRDIEVPLELRIVLDQVLEPCPFCGFEKPRENQVDTRQQKSLRLRHEGCLVIK